MRRAQCVWVSDTVSQRVRHGVHSGWLVVASLRGCRRAGMISSTTLMFNFFIFSHFLSESRISWYVNISVRDFCTYSECDFSRMRRREKSWTRNRLWWLLERIPSKVSQWPCILVKGHKVPSLSFVMCVFYYLMNFRFYRLTLRDFSMINKVGASSYDAA